MFLNPVILQRASCKGPLGEGTMTFNSKTAWGWPAKTLHWIGAAIILVLLTHGWWMTHVSPRPDRLANYAWHSALGYDLLALIVLRLLWRWLNAVRSFLSISERGNASARASGTFRSMC
jgi:cytochrome b561